MGFPGLLERKEPWELLGLDRRAPRGRKVHQAVPGKKVLLVPVVLQVLPVSLGCQVVVVLPDPLVFLAFQARRESAPKDPKEKLDSWGNEDLKVQLGVWDLLVLQVQVSKETWGTKGWQERRDHLVVAGTLVLQAWWVQMDQQVHLDKRAPWETSESPDPWV